MNSSNGRSLLPFVALVPLVLMVCASLAYAGDPSPAVRVLDAGLAATLRDSYAASRTMRALVDELEASDVIVHVVSMGPRPHEVSGMLSFVQATNGYRILRIAINPRVAPGQRAAILAHELQHAVEVSRGTSAIDAASFAALYQQIGYRVFSETPTCAYETAEARRVGERVSKELRCRASRSKDH